MPHHQVWHYLLPHLQHWVLAQNLPITIFCRCFDIGRKLTYTGSSRTPPFSSCTLRIFGEGAKVCCEIAIMAADAGLVRTDEDVICVGGSHREADTAMVLRPVNTHRFFDMKVKEILCKPLNPLTTVQPSQTGQK